VLKPSTPLETSHKAPAQAPKIAAGTSLSNIAIATKKGIQRNTLAPKTSNKPPTEFCNRTENVNNIPKIAHLIYLGLLSP
jgi:hypothetical protein